ncbi:MAG: putative FAD-dependent dehydrogenase [Candidatus Azotimanducaceae bacterium]|jgi:uncharacterized FAD-dependent dehydrogenase
MIRLTEIKLPLDHGEHDLALAIVERLNITSNDIRNLSVFKRSYDARNKKNILLIYQVDVELDSDLEKDCLQKTTNSDTVRPSPDMTYQFVGKTDKKLTLRPVVVGFGPCGILAALLLAQMGLRPIVLERGQAVRQRTKDTWNFWRKSKLHTGSNVQFGEGGAGTFSDGKLYSLIKDRRFLGRKVLNEFVSAGAPKDILFQSKPHVGTFKLVKMVENLRAQIIELGGEIRFGAKVETIHREEGVEGTGKISGLTLEGGELIETQHVVLAIGHSARDTFQMLLDQKIYIEAKPFSIGFRIEHPQSVIDKARFGEYAGNKILGAADYKLVHHCSNGRSVYSFCMCPGGTVVAAASEDGGVVTNGMSQYSRNERNANSAIVCGITPEKDFPDHVLAGIDLQRKLEKIAYHLGGEDFKAPAQLVGDFLADKTSMSFGSVKPSYQPGIKLGDLSSLLPIYAIEAIREAIPAFDKQIKGFSMNDAILTGVETRTSSPICIKRDASFQSLNTQGLYPAGEGAGYAGGILSAAIDGIKVAEAIAVDTFKKLEPQG